MALIESVISLHLLFPDSVNIPSVSNPPHYSLPASFTFSFSSPNALDQATTVFLLSCGNSFLPALLSPSGHFQSYWMAALDVAPISHFLDIPTAILILSLFYQEHWEQPVLQLPSFYCLSSSVYTYSATSFFAY